MASHEAIRQLMDLGISQEQAREALARYNNDVAHAADYIFSGAVDTSNEQANSPSNITTATATTATTTTTAAAVWDDTSVWPPWSTMEMDTQSVDSTRGSAGSTQGGEPLEQEQTEDTGREQQQHLQQQQEWSVVPFRPYSSTSGVEKRGRNGIAWEEPSDPRDRAAVENRPIGLRPPKHKMPFTPAVFQALFHLPCLQQSVMSFHPKKFLWGSPQDYWQGRGEKTSLYSLGSLPASEQQEMGRSRLEAKEMQDPWCTKMNEEESDKASEKDGTEGFELLSLSQSLPEVPEVSTVNMDMNENYSMDLEPIPRCLQGILPSVGDKRHRKEKKKLTTE
ncbi:hypothetical protein BDF14DRAFT_1768135 [Spinellus fusiger]|nr:hypothetical protein BDF14DRAFT_1768135 [Spinellus fusiger]